MKKSKKKSLQNSVNQINSSNKTNKIWKMVQKISGKTQLFPVKHLDWFSLFNGISAFFGYLMPKLSFYKNSKDSI